jgi:glutathione reductase (NADPH)
MVAMMTGYIAIELGGIFHSLDSSVDIFFRGSSILKSFDSLIISTLTEEMVKTGVRLHPESSHISVVKEADNTYSVKLKNNGVDETHTGYDCVLSAIGRVPNSDDIDIEKLGEGERLVAKETGYIKVDAFQNTVVPNV